MTFINRGNSGQFLRTGLVAMAAGVLLSSSAVAGLNVAGTARPAPAASHATNVIPVAATQALGFGTPTVVSLSALATDKAQIATLRVNKALPSTLTWSVMPAGVRVADRVTQREVLFTTALTSRAVRPQAIVPDDAHGVVWFYGEDLYRYRIADGDLTRFRPTQGAFGAIRELLLDASGLWLATDNGAYHFDALGEYFSAIRHPLLSAGTRFVQAAAANDDIWFVTEPTRLIRMARVGAGTVEVAASRSLPLGVAAEMQVVNRTVWLLASRENGEHYELAFVDTRDGQLRRVAGKYFSLREQQGQLLATTHRTLHVFDPVAGTVAVLMLDSSRALGRLLDAGEVLFLGSSYGMKDNCEVVEHRRVDISKGWQSPGPELYAPAASIPSRGVY